MAKMKRALKLALVATGAVALGVSLASCADNTALSEDKTQTEQTQTQAPEDAKSVKVSFMIPENGDTSKYKLLEEVKTDKEGKLKVPQAPAIQGYTFRGWYLDKEFKTKFEVNSTKLTKDSSLYALYVKDTIKLHVIDGEGNEVVLEEEDLVDLDKLTAEQEKAALAKNLTFDGWYTNAACTTKYTPGSEAFELYAQYMAKVTFNNGYEVLAEALVKPGKTASKPEINDEFVKSYMSKDDIFFVDSENRDFNFTNALEANTEIRVLWKSPFLDIKPIKNSKDYYVNGFDLQPLTKEERLALDNFPVISIPSRIILNGEEVKVNSVYGATILSPLAAKHLIINEGIESIYSLTEVSGSSKLTDITLPSTVRVIDSSFNGLKYLEHINVEEGVEAVFDSFWKDFDGLNQSEKDKAYDFVTLPKSVNNISDVPADINFAAGSAFFSEDGCLYKNDEKLGKVLVSVNKNSVKNGVLEVKSGVQAIQVGTFNTVKYDILILPESFTAVSYNNDVNDYAGLQISKRFTDYDNIGLDTNPANAGTMSPLAYAIVSNLNEVRYVNFEALAYPENMSRYAFSNGDIAYDELEDIHCIFTKKVSEGMVTLTVNVSNPRINYADRFEIEYAAGDILTKEDLLSLVNVTEEDLGYKFDVNFIREFGNDFDFSKAIDSNKYIDLEFVAHATGFTVEFDEAGNAVVTGFDMESAEAKDGGYTVNITSTFSGKPVVGIKEGAFENNTDIFTIYVPASVKYIGARAFKGMKNVSRIEIATGGLETIGEEAFMYVGAIEQNGTWVANPTLPPKDANGQDIPPKTFIELPLATLKEVGANAFNSPAIREFTPAKGEAPAKYAGMNYTAPAKKVGQFVFLSDNYAGMIYGLMKITGLEREATPTAATLYTADFVANAAGAKGTSFAFGQVSGMMSNVEVLKVTVKSGSVAIYEDTYDYIAFGAVNKVEKNAITYINPKLLELRENGTSHIEYSDPVGNMIKVPLTDLLTKEQVSTQDQEIFEEGWLLGRANIENESLMTNLTKGSNYTGK